MTLDDFLTVSSMYLIFVSSALACLFHLAVKRRMSKGKLTSSEVTEFFGTLQPILRGGLLAFATLSYAEVYTSKRKGILLAWFSMISFFATLLIVGILESEYAYGTFFVLILLLITGLEAKFLVSLYNQLLQSTLVTKA